MSEHAIQSALFSWALMQEGMFPELRLLHAIPNGGKRDKVIGAKMKREGQKAGVPDVNLPVARGKYIGLYIEMKFGKNTTTDTQEAWLEALEAEGHFCAVFYDWLEAADCIIEYLALGKHYS